MKFEWKKQAKQFYMPKDEPEIVTVPEMKFFMLDGKGNPNSEEFSEAVRVLYSLAYAVKMLPKKGVTPEGYFDYTVFPLEGVWDLAEEARGLDKLDKDQLIYTIMIRQPDFVTEEIVQVVMENVRKTKYHPLLETVRFGSLEEGVCVQMMHHGSYDSEPNSFARMEEFSRMNNLKRISKTHREIYISDARKTSPDKLKTVLRFQVEQQ
ncbi:GyrI-like domain-containing protein [Brevibacillus sp. SYSU BS000544]|uniref:GyrI-like domain-containing protein n=1 Tax=Brevibacillus sp. SYSU BS000544 TaxID=3416443 RepID=UPI003CE4D4BB